ncbi:hypothetical protein A3D66_02520 [Candidatus Kaiserbacteria bacterium RIFCSPHIGHO2_02_FULL_50_9]|nr:MAG: hypothetical protein A3D66_02520 [Candidatus Kaiserbacteria bacterium RIFCSPHIGHO2_02_FULL_50_9]
MAVDGCWFQELKKAPRDAEKMNRTIGRHLPPMRQGKEICPVCNTVQLTYIVEGKEKGYFVEHTHRGVRCKGSHTAR